MFVPDAAASPSEKLRASLRLKVKLFLLTVAVSRAIPLIIGLFSPSGEADAKK